MTPFAASAQTPARPTPASTTAAPAADEMVTLEAFTVTGSNIKGVDTERTLPVTLITADDITMSGVNTMTELVETLPFSTTCQHQRNGDRPK
ncbi:MAG: hypothetical protein ACREH8_09580 [Opitutaceae bacterium]